MNKPLRWATRCVAMLAMSILLPGGAAATVPDKAPEFVGISHWINSEPLRMQDLRGKVVLVDFWAYSCINCLRTLPHVTAWYDRYKDRGLVIVGVHTPEFEFEKSQANVEQAVREHGIHYPVAMDNDMGTWWAWNNRFWPAKYLIDRDGKVVMHRYGEGHYAQTENAIRKLLGLDPLSEGVADKDFSGIGTPEIYFGLARVTRLANPLPLPRMSHRYDFPEAMGLNRFALEGRWKLANEYAQQSGDEGAIRLRFQAAEVNMVASSAEPVTLEIRVDGKLQPPVTVQASRLYRLWQAATPGEHMIEIRTRRAGLKAYTFTFG